MKKAILAVVLVAVMSAGVGFWYFLVRDDELDISPQNVNRAQVEDVDEQDSADGNWVLRKQSDVFAGYEIQELFGGETLKKAAIGRAREVSGSFTLKGTEITNGKIEVDMTSLESDSSRRDSSQKNEGLETNRFPTATFAQTHSATVSTPLAKNKEVTTSMVGDLTLHGVTQEVTVELTALWDGRVITVSGSIGIDLQEFDIEPPDSSFVSVDDNGTIKLQLLFVPHN